MRIDQYLKKTSIFKKRTEAKIMCERNLIKLNGRPSKPSKSVMTGDVIEIETPHGIKQIRVLQIPTGNVSKDHKELYYEEIQ
jgi:ribosomal 50S subunit-recycling heat shock protein